ncbi:MAG: alpha-ketoacid dehydrogenase subunit beta [Fimbriimonadaceae bacterium]|nr:alpha-ketoacid dehydrogenase subunit beta [Fimbriimonadaceae bacterium]
MSKAADKTQTLTMVQAINAAIAQEMERDPNVILLGEDVAHYGGMFRVTEGLLDKFGEKRVWDTPISESGFIGMSLGLALTGKRPIAELMFIDFSLVAMDQILNQIAKTRYMTGGHAKVPLVIRTQGGGYKGAAAQHSQMLEALFLHVPGLKVVAPSTPADAKGLLAAAIRDDNPVVFIEHKQLYTMKGEVPAGEHVVPLGKAAVVREGSQVSLISYSYTLQLCLEAAEALAKEGVDAEVIDLRTLNPLDFETIAASIRKTHRAVIAHEAHGRLGVGADLAAQIQEKLFDDLDAPILRITGKDVPIPFNKGLEDQVLPSVERIVETVRRVL